MFGRLLVYIGSGLNVLLVISEFGINATTTCFVRCACYVEIRDAKIAKAQAKGLAFLQNRLAFVFLQVEYGIFF